MYYPPLFTSVRPFDPRANPLGGALDVPVVGTGRENPLDLSVKTIRQSADSTAEADDLLMLDHRKLANLAASHSLSAMGRQLLDPTLFRLGYGADGTPCATMIPGLAPPFCYDRATGVAVPTSIAGHPLMTGFLQQQQQREHQQAAALRAQQAAVAAAFMDPSTLPLHLRNGLTQREAAAALAATRALYAPTLPAPMVLPAFSLYTEDKGAFTSLRGAGEKNFLNGSGALEAARFAEHLQRLREQHLQHQQGGKCGNACCTATTSAGMTPQTSVPCACCVPSQPALSARSPMACSKDVTPAASAGKVAEYPQPSSFLHRPSVTTTTAHGDIRLSVSSLVTTKTNTEPTTVNSSRDKHTTPIWNAGLPTVTSSGKTAFSVPKKKENPSKDSPASKECKALTSMKDILKDAHTSASYEAQKSEAPKINSIVKQENLKREEKDPAFLSEEYAKFFHREASHCARPFPFPKATSSPSGLCNGNDSITTVTSVTPVVPTKCEGGTIPITKMPPLLEAMRPTELPPAKEQLPDASTAVPSPQGPPPLIAVSGAEPTIKPPTENNAMMASFVAHKQPKSESGTKSSVRSPKKSQSHARFNGLPPGCLVKEEPLLALPKPIPHLPAAHHLPSAHYASHYRPAQHQLNLQSHNGWIPPAHPNVTVTTTTASTSASSVVTSAPLRPSIFPAAVNGGESANVLHSLLVRPSGQEQSAPMSVPMPTVPVAGTSVITPSTNGPLYGLDYRYHFNHHQLSLAGVLPPSSMIPTAAAVNLGNTQASSTPSREVKPEPATTATQSHGSKKRPNGVPNGRPSIDEAVAAKKRMLLSDYTTPVPRYSFPASTYAPEASEAPECPYTFVPEPPLSFSQQIKTETPQSQKLFKRETSERHQEHIPFSCDASKSNLLSKSPPTTGVKALPMTSMYHSLRPEDRLSEIRAKRKLRRRLLSRLYQRKSAPLSPIDRTSLHKQLAIQHMRKVLSQLTLRWSHRRYMYKWYLMKGRNAGEILKIRRKKKNGQVVYKIKRDKLGKGKSSVGDAISKGSEQSSTLPMPSEMKRLMVNKALGETILHRAARLGYPEVVAYCLETTCGNVNARDNAGYTPLHECCSRGHLDIARALLQYGADVNASAAGGIRPLHDAVENDHVEIVRLLLSYGADPSIATYSGLEPIKLARSPMMAEFLQGFLADISGEADSRPHLPWRFWGSSRCLDPEESGYDVFEGVPSDPECEGEGDNDFLFEVSDSPHLPTFRLLLPAANNKAHCNYLRLSDVLRKLSMTKGEFLEAYPHIEILTLPRHEFEASATCSQLLTGTKLDNLFVTRPNLDRLLDSGNTTDLVRLDNSIRLVLGIETISVR